MPPRKVKKSASSTEQSVLFNEIEPGVQERIEYLKEKLAERQAEDNASVLSKIHNSFPAETLDMLYVDYVANYITSKKDKEKPEVQVARQLLEAVKESHIHENDVDMESDRHSTLSQEGSVPISSHYTPTKVDEDRLQLRTPSGVALPIPKLIRPKVDSELQNMFRKPKEGEEIAFSIQGSPMVLPIEDPKMEELRMMLTDNVEQSPETRKMTIALQEHLRKKRILAGKADVKQEPGTSV